MMRRNYMAGVIRQGWTIVSADEGFVVAKADDR